MRRSWVPIALVTALVAALLPGAPPGASSDFAPIPENEAQSPPPRAPGKSSQPVLELPKAVSTPAQPAQSPEEGSDRPGELTLAPLLGCWRGIWALDSTQYIGGCPKPTWWRPTTVGMCLRVDRFRVFSVAVEGAQSTKVLSTDGEGHIELNSSGASGGNAFVASWNCDLVNRKRTLSCHFSELTSCRGRNWYRNYGHVAMERVRPY
jgi:hypothetical protein